MVAGRLPPGSPASEQGVHLCLLKMWHLLCVGLRSWRRSFHLWTGSMLLKPFIVHISMVTPYLFFNDGRPMSEFLVAYTRL